ncbi:Smr/MutS family protein [soil metagenome]
MNLEETKKILEFEKVLSKVSAYCYSGLGQSLCEEIEFFTDKVLLETELQKVKEMKTLLVRENYLQLDGLQDIRNIIKKLKIEGGFISTADFLWILNFLRVSRVVYIYFKKIKNDYPDDFSNLIGLTSGLQYDKLLESNIESTIDENGEVKDSASKDLRRIRDSLRSREENLRKTLTKILKNISEKDYSQEDIVTQRDGRFVLPVKAENKRAVPGIIHSTSYTGATVFIEPGETIEMNNEITELQYEEKREIERILRELSKKIAGSHPFLENNCRILGEVDFLQAKAKYALEITGDKPMLSEDFIAIKKGYHPTLLATHQKNTVVPIDIELGKDFNTIVISGPNAGGKTVAMKTVGLLQLILQSGMLVPCHPASTFKIFTKIFVNIGDQQSLENDLSTFSSHLRALKDIAEHCDKNSLILIDEICSGTDPVLGSALSAAFLKYLSGKDAKVIVTTHNGDLKVFAYNEPAVENASLEFDAETLSPNFHFNMGIPGQSFTFEIAEKFKLNNKIIADAKGLLSSGENNLEEILKELNENRSKYNELKNKFDIENVRLNGLISLYQTNVEKLKNDEKAVLRKAKEEAKKLIDDANKLIENTIKKIREDKNFSAKEVKDSFRNKFNEIINIVEDEEEKLTVINEKIAVGDSVRIKGSESVGNVIEIEDKNVSVNMNGLLLRSKLSEVEKVSHRKVKKEYSRESLIEINDKPVSTSVDLRGMYPDDIGIVLDKFLHDSFSGGLKEITIVHGKGGGVLREEVKKYLKGNKTIKSFRGGNWNEGDMGVTVVEL